MCHTITQWRTEMSFFSRKRASSTAPAKPAVKGDHECCKEKGTAADVKNTAAPQTGNAPKAPAGGCCGGKHAH
jgi:hypothetical protein